MKINFHLYTNFISVFFLLLLIPGIFRNTNAAETVQLIFRDSVLVDDTVFYLGQLCDIASADKPLVDQLEKTVAGISAPPGFSRLITIDNLLLFKVEPLFKSIHFLCSRQGRIVIETAFNEACINDYQQMIYEYFKNSVNWPEGCWKLSIHNQHHKWKCLKAPVVARVEGPNEPFPRGNVSAMLRFVQGTKKHDIPILATVSVNIPVVISTKSIKRGENISITDCEMKELDITHFSPVPFRSMDEVNGMRAARTIAPGTILHDRIVFTIPLIEKNDQVEILLSKGRVKVAIQGIARESGVKNDVIWVENAVSHKLIRATIVNKGTVIVNQGGSSI